MEAEDFLFQTIIVVIYQESDCAYVWDGASRGLSQSEPVLELPAWRQDCHLGGRLDGPKVVVVRANQNIKRPFPVLHESQEHHLLSRGCRAIDPTRERPGHMMCEIQRDVLYIEEEFIGDILAIDFLCSYTLSKYLLYRHAPLLDMVI